jgi:uncharacterized protein YlxP (DUF503 family)
VASNTIGQEQHAYNVLMYLGTLQVWLILRQSRSLKDKRQVVSSIKDRLQQSFNISVAEVDLLDDRQQVVLGIAMVSNEMSHLQGALQKIVDALRSHPVAEMSRHVQHVEAALFDE